MNNPCCDLAFLFSLNSADSASVVSSSTTPSDDEDDVDDEESDIDAILKNMEEFKEKQLMIGDRYLISDLKIKIHIFQSYVKITDLENAEVIGKDVKIYTFETDKFIFSKIKNIQEIETCDILIEKIKEHGLKLITEHKKGIKVWYF